MLGLPCHPCTSPSQMLGLQTGTTLLGLFLASSRPQSYPMQRGSRVPIREAKHLVVSQGKLVLFLLSEDEIRSIKEALEYKSVTLVGSHLLPSPPASAQGLFQLRISSFLSVCPLLGPCSVHLLNQVQNQTRKSV